MSVVNNSVLQGLGVLRVGMAMTAAARAMGAVTRAMGPIGIFLTVGMMIFEAGKAIFNMLKSDEQKNLEKNVKDADDILEELAGTFKELDLAAKGQSLNQYNTYSALYCTWKRYFYPRPIGRKNSSPS